MPANVAEHTDKEGNLIIDVKGRGRWRMTPNGKIEKFHADEWWPANLALVHSDALRAFADECDYRADPSKGAR